MPSALNGSTRACPGHKSFQWRGPGIGSPRETGLALRGGDLEVGGGSALGLRVFLEDGEDEAGADDGQEPDELGLPDLLLALVEAALEHADGEPGLEGDDGKQGGGSYVTDLDLNRLMAPLSFVMSLQEYSLESLFTARTVIDAWRAAQRWSAERPV